jgi:hypothetical protein
VAPGVGAAPVLAAADASVNKTATSVTPASKMSLVRHVMVVTKTPLVSKKREDTGETSETG